MNQEFNPERRKHDRHGRMGLIVRLNGENFEAHNWSMGGFLLSDYRGNLSTGALVTVEGIGCDKTKMYDVKLPARVVRVDEGTIAVNYLNLDREAYDFLSNALATCGVLENETKI